jgi:hypothetical protein
MAISGKRLRKVYGSNRKLYSIYISILINMGQTFSNQKKNAKFGNTEATIFNLTDNLHSGVAYMEKPLKMSKSNS